MIAVTGLNKPDFRTISTFRRRHLVALRGLFVQVLRLCQTAGLVKLGHVAVDGTKLRANASRHKAMSYKRMAEQERKLEAEVKAWLDQAQAADAAEDAQHGADHRGDETPAWMADKQRRLERIRAAKAQLEAEARAGADTSDAEALSVILCAGSVSIIRPRTYRRIGWRTGSWPRTTRAAVASSLRPLD